MSRLALAASPRFNLASRPVLLNAHFSSTPSKSKKEPRKPHVPRPYKAPPGANPVRRTRIHGSTLKLKFVDPIKIEGKRMKLEVDTIFENESLAKERVNDFIRDKLADCDIPTISSLLRVSAQTLKNEPESLLKSHLPAIARRLDALSSEPWSFMHISFVVYGLQYSKEKDRHSLSILGTMAKVATVTLQGDKPPMDQDISMILLGIQNNSSEQKETIAMLKVVHEMLNVSTSPFLAQSMSNAFYGMKGLTSDCPEALAVLAALAPKVIKCKAPMSPQQISFALCGLQGMSCNYPEVISALQALNPRVVNIPKTFRAQHVGNAMLGLQKMGSEHPEVINMMSALLPEFKHCRESLNPEEIKKVMFFFYKNANNNFYQNSSEMHCIDRIL